MPEDNITVALCDAKMKSVDGRLERIERDGAETREGVEKLLRILVEGNSQPSLVSRIQDVERTAEDLQGCVDEQKAKEADRVLAQAVENRAKRQTRFALWLAVGGWIVTIVGIFAKFIKL